MVQYCKNFCWTEVHSTKYTEVPLIRHLTSGILMVRHVIIVIVVTVLTDLVIREVGNLNFLSERVVFTVYILV